MAAKLKLIIKRAVCAVLIAVVLLFNIEIKPVQANPIVVAGVELTPYVVAALGSLFATAGISFSTNADLENAIKTFAYNNPVVFVAAAGAVKGSEVIGSSVEVAVPVLKDFFDYTVNFYKDMFKPSEIEVGGSISTSYDVVQVKYWNGIPVIVSGIPETLVEVNIGLYPNTPTKEEWTNEAINRLNKIKQYSVSSPVNYDTGLTITLETIDKISYLKHITTKETRVYRTVYDPFDIFFTDSCIFYRVSTNGETIHLSFLYATTYVEHDYSRYRAFFGESNILLNWGIPSYSSSLLIDMPYSASVSDINTLQDTSDYSATIDAISSIAGTGTLSDTDTVNIRVLDDPISATREGVVVGATDVPIDPPIDVPVDPPIENTGELDFTGLKMNVELMASVFPFCIPFDFINAIKSMVAPPKVPVFKIDFKGTVFGDYVWELNFADFESLAVIMRWGLFLGFIVGLMMNTGRFIKW